MVSRILVPLDGSKLSENILPYARWLVKELKLPVELLHAVDPDIVSLLVNPSEGRYAPDIEAVMKRKAVEYLAPVAASLPEPRAARCRVEVGRPAEVIVARAAADPNTLIAMATHGRSEVQRWLLGSVAHKVLLTTSSPLLLVRPDGKFENLRVAPLERLIVPLDGSDLAERALPYAGALAKKLGLEISLAQVYSFDGMIHNSLDGYVPDWERLRETIKRETQSYLDQVSDRLTRTGVRQLSTAVLRGEPAEEIIKLARRTPHSLVVMCTHGRSGIGRLLLGSVTDRVVRHSGDPVLVIRAHA
jgi:nucleotide-binding universal stress UspA family protein